MRVSLTGLRRIIREELRSVVLSEGAPPVQPNLAVVVNNDDTLKDVTVYDVNRLAYAINDASDGGKISVSDSIVGWISIAKPENPCAGAWEVLQVAGPGLGKVLYGIGYALAPGGLLMPDRHMVSRDAENAWKSAAASGRKSVTLDDVEHRDSRVHSSHHTDDASDDCEVHDDDVLDRAYEAEGWEAGVLRELMNNHREFIGSFDFDVGELKRALLKAGNRFFLRMYKR